MENATVIIRESYNLTKDAVEEMAFSWYDYVLFSLMLVLSVMIGIYFGCFGKKQNSTNEYLLGGKEMAIVPIAMSLVSSMVSGITILAVPADIYSFGITFWVSSATMPIVCVITTYVYLPVFYECQITSTYEYLELRFDKKSRVMASCLFTLCILLYLPIVVYIPALAFAQATGINLHFITPLVCSVCIFYTTIGGLKAVVWTDALQLTAMLGAIGAVFYLGTASAGGISEVWRISKEGQRLDFDFDISPFKRDTFWGAAIGMTINWLSYIVANQGAIQKFLALGNMKSVKITMVVFIVGMVTVMSSSVFSGFIMYAKYHDCDPISNGKVTRPDQLLPYYVMDVAGNIPGLPGLFIAGLFCAALSTLSAVMNSLAGTVYEDFIKPFLSKNTSPETTGRILKGLVVFIGVLATSLVFVVEQLGGILPLSMSLQGITQGPLMGLFTFGMLVPFATAAGAFYGGVTAILFMAWVVAGSQYYKAIGIINYTPLPVSTEGCDFYMNVTESYFSNSTTTEESYVPFFLYRISYYYYSLLGSSMVFIIGLPISWYTRKRDEPVNKALISPIIHWMLPKNEPKEYYSIDVASKIVDTNGVEKLEKIER